MARRARTDEPRASLTRAHVLGAAVDVADQRGIASLTMRSLAAHLGIEAMSLYHHVAGKEDLLDGMVDVVFGEIHRPRIGDDWAVEMRSRSTSGREVLGRHRWAVGLMDSRSAPGPETLGHHDAVLGCLRRGGFSVAMAAHAFAVLDAHLYGFMLQELSLPFQRSEDIEELATSMLADLPADTWPHLTEMVTEHVMRPGYAFGDEFEFGLDLVIDGLERALHRQPAAQP